MKKSLDVLQGKLKKSIKRKNEQKLNQIQNIQRKIITNGVLNEYKADSQPVALYTGDVKEFTKHTIQLNEGDLLYLYSDGFQDQFGGERGKKYMSGKFKKFLLSISEMTMEQQEYLVKVEFTNWMGENEQIDDVCVMGVRIT